jgi:hypothetical protein
MNYGFNRKVDLKALGSANVKQIFF